MMPEFEEKPRLVWEGFDSNWHEGQAEAVKRVVLWSRVCLERRAGWTIVLSGKPGCGKTALANVIGRYFRYYEGLTESEVKVIDEPTLFERLWTASKLQEITSCQRARLLVLDDVGTAHINSTSWAASIYWQLFNQRHERGRATFLTTNLERGDFAQLVGGRCWSRLVDGMRTRDFFIDLADLGVPDYRSQSFYQTSLDDLLNQGAFDV